MIKSSLWLIVHKYYFLFPGCLGNPSLPMALPSLFTSSWQSDWTSSPCLSWQSWAQGGQLRRRERAGCGFWPLRAPTPPPLPGAERPSPWPGSNAGAPPEIKHKNTHTPQQLTKGKSTSRGAVCVFVSWSIWLNKWKWSRVYQWNFKAFVRLNQGNIL